MQPTRVRRVLWKLRERVKVGQILGVLTIFREHLVAVRGKQMVLV